MAGNVKLNDIKRRIKTTEGYLGISLWKYFLVIFALCTVFTGGIEFALHFKRGTDMTSLPFVSGLFAMVLIQTVLWTAILRYFARRDLKKLQRELEMEEESRGG